MTTRHEPHFDQSNSSRRSRDEVDGRGLERSNSGSVKKRGLIERLFNVRTWDEEDAELEPGRLQRHDVGRRHLLQIVDKQDPGAHTSLSMDSDETMMAQASADSLIDDPARLHLAKPRPPPGNSAPAPSKPRLPPANPASNVKPRPVTATVAHSTQNESEETRREGPLPRRGVPTKSDSTRAPPRESSKDIQPPTGPPAGGRYQGKLQRNRFAGHAAGGVGRGGGKGTGGSFKRRSMKMAKPVAPPKVDTSAPLVFPCSPEAILEYHKVRPILDQTEEWLVVELNEYECLVDSLAILRIVAKHSKFFEVEPDELWTEFFDFVDEVPAYDEVVNFDIWQEFRDKKYSR